MPFREDWKNWKNEKMLSERASTDIKPHSPTDSVHTRACVMQQLCLGATKSGLRYASSALSTELLQKGCSAGFENSVGHRGARPSPASFK